MARSARRTNPDLWDRVKAEVTSSDRGGNPGQWSARKAQLAVQEYKKQGGGYAGPKSADNSLRKWTEEDWGTRSGERSRESGERYLPKRARAALTTEEYDRTTAKKRTDTRNGRQFSQQPDDVANKVAAQRRQQNGRHATADTAAGKSDLPSKAELYKRAQARGLAGRSKMNRRELAHALRENGGGR